MPVLPPDRTSTTPFGRYIIRERIARGGMGEVFRAVAVGADGFEKAVVVKRLLPKFAGRSDLADLFSAEAKLMTRLVHPNIVQVIDFGRSENDDCFLVMELVSGLDLGRLTRWHEQRGEHVAPAVALFIVSQVLRGLAYAHGTFSADGARLVHRDISPGNVLLSTFGEVKVADFGVALVVQRADIAGQESGLIAGKPGYIAPEQWSGRGVDERADLYSLGALSFEILTGQLPLVDQKGGEQHLAELSRAALCRVASPPLADIVFRALAYDAEDRFSDARSMGQAIAHVVAQGHPIATPDELAEIVAHATSEIPDESRRVVLLSDEAAQNAGAISGTVLTRSGQRGRFTMRLTEQEAAQQDAPDMTDGASGAVTESMGTEGPLGTRLEASSAALGSDARAARRGVGARSHLARGLALAMLVSILLLFGRFGFGRWSPATIGGALPLGSAGAQTQAASTPPRAAATPSNDEPARLEQLAAEPSIAASSPPADAGRENATSPTLAAAPLHPRLEGARPTRSLERTPAPTEAPSDRPDCRGQLHAYASHGWIVHGGPETVQAPGRYNWPCGVYNLTAVSRIDSQDKRRMTLAVRSGAASILDLR